MDISYRFTIDNQELILERCDLAFLNTIDKLPDGTDPGVLYKLFSISALNLYKIPTENENFYTIEEFFKTSALISLSLICCNFLIILFPKKPFAPVII